MIKFKAKGKIRFSGWFYVGVDHPNPPWVVLDCEPDLPKYYAWFVRKHRGIKLLVPQWESHISVVRGESIDPELLEKYKKYEGKEFEFTYIADIVNENTEYFWLDVQCPELEQLRVDFGLPPTPIFSFHLTIGKLPDYNRSYFLKNINNRIINN